MMRGPLDSGEITALGGLVARCREALTKDLGARLEGRFGIRPDGTEDPEEKLRLDNGDLLTRDELLGVRQHFLATGESGVEATRRLLREAVFTHLNRIVAIRISSPESILGRRNSREFGDLVDVVAPLLGADETGGYWTYLQLRGDELAADAPVLFDPRNPLLSLAPSPSVLDFVIDQLANFDLQDIWHAPDTLGWVYQYFNTAEERKQMREHHAPRNWRELAIRNQFFTPGYVVSYLVENTLGRRLVEADSSSGLVGDLEWLVDPPAAGQPLELTEVRVLDPACGSGHFLLGAYDLLERAWSYRGVTPEDAAERILPCLWGIDIDPRAVQVAAAALMLRARRSAGKTRVLPQPNVICARPLPLVPADLLESLTASQRRLLADLREQLTRAPVLGSLLKVEGIFSSPFGPHPLPAGALTAPASSTSDAMRDMEEILAVVEAAADRATSSPGERLTAAEAHDAIRFVRAVGQSYDAVLMNPPFGEPVEGTRDYLKSEGAYPWAPSKDANLLALFVGRGLELCDQHGYMGAITSRAGMFLTTFQRWRKEVLLDHQLVTMADLGPGVMKDAMVEAAAYVLSARSGLGSRPATFLRLLREPELSRGRSLKELIALGDSGQSDRVFRVAPADFRSIPGYPIAYWMHPSIRRLFVDLPSLEGHGAEVRQGLATGDDFRFVRAFWEVDPRRIARTREETFQNKRWVPFAKGGEYSPFWSDIHLVVDYGRDGEVLKGFEGSVIRNPNYYFRPGLTWPRRTQAGFNPAVLPGGCVFADKGPAIFPLNGKSPLLILGYLLSRPSLALLETVTTFGSYEVGAVSRLPWPANYHHPSELALATKRIVDFKVEMDGFQETSRYFVSSPIPKGNDVHSYALSQERERLGRAAELLEEWGRSEREVVTQLELEIESLVYLDTQVGAIPVSSVESSGDLDVADPDSLPRPPRWVDDALESGAAKNGLGVRAYLAQLTDTDLMVNARVRAFPHDLFSYLIGCAFGRWDIRVGRNPALALAFPDSLEPVPVCPPGMLVDADRLPARIVPADYPLSLPPHQLLFDEPGHRFDAITAIEAGAAVLNDDPDRILGELSSALGGNLRHYLHSGFFKEHLSRYSKSRRKAPIYWPLMVPSKSWGVWIYAPALNPETLFAIEAAADARLHAASTELRRLESEQLSDAGRPERELAGLLESGRRLTEELRQFHQEAHRIAHIGWEPDLDDGIVLCAAPLADLFPDWKVELTSRRNEIRRGVHDWSTVHRHRSAL